MYKMILAETELLALADMSSVRYAVVGSAEVPDELMAEFKRVFTRAEIAEGYGLTEGGPVPVTNTRWGFKKRGSCGLAFPGSDVDLVDEAGRVVDGEGVGELIARNPGLAQGYWKLPEVTARKFRDGWLHTGDLMRRDADGYYYFIGRKDDMINVAGENVYPKEVEDILLHHPGLRDACVVPAHAVKGVPVAYVVAREGGPSEADVKAFFLERGAPYAHPRRVVFLEALPLGGTGKLDRAALGIAPAPRPSANDRRASLPTRSCHASEGGVHEPSIRRHFLSITAGVARLAATPLLWRHARRREIGSAPCASCRGGLDHRRPAVEGIKMAVDEINKTGGISAGPGIGAAHERSSRTRRQGADGRHQGQARQRDRSTHSPASSSRPSRCRYRNT